MRFGLPSLDRQQGLSGAPRLEDEADIADDDFVITDVTRGGYSVTVGGRNIASPRSIETALEVVRARMERDRFYPNVWYVNDHGNIDLLDSRGNIIKSWV